MEYVTDLKNRKKNLVEYIDSQYVEIKKIESSINKEKERIERKKREIDRKKKEIDRLNNIEEILIIAEDENKYTKMEKINEKYIIADEDENKYSEERVIKFFKMGNETICEIHRKSDNLLLGVGIHEFEVHERYDIKVALALSELRARAKMYSNEIQGIKDQAKINKLGF